MASVSPTITATDEPSTFVRGGAVTDNTKVLSVDASVLNFLGLKLSIFYFAAVGDGDTWDTSSTIKPVRRPLACAWQGDDVDDDIATAFVTDVGGIGDDSTIEFQTGGAGKTGWLWVLHQP